VKPGDDQTKTILATLGVQYKGKYIKDTVCISEGICAD